jgi:hypothetical protein
MRRGLVLKLEKHTVGDRNVALRLHVERAGLFPPLDTDPWWPCQRRSLRAWQGCSCLQRFYSVVRDAC